MSKRLLAIVLAVTVVLPPAIAATKDGSTPSVARGTASTLEGEHVDFEKLLGGTVGLVFNSASRCGYTSQLEDLQALHKRYSARGVKVVGVPSNDFRQEPDADAKIKEFCTRNYGVTFTMLRRRRVVGEHAGVPFRAINAQAQPPDWNFTKYLIGRDGRVRARFSPSTSPTDKRIVRKLDALLAEQRS